MIQMAEKGEKKLLDLFYRIKNDETQTIYRAFFLNLKVFPEIVQRTMQQIDDLLDSVHGPNSAYQQSPVSLFIPPLHTIHSGSSQHY